MDVITGEEKAYNRLVCAWAKIEMKQYIRNEVKRMIEDGYEPEIPPLDMKINVKSIPFRNGCDVNHE